MRRRSFDLLLVGLLAVAATGLALSPAGPAFLRPLLNVPLVLFLPGYALIAALLPRLTARAELTALSLATSLGLAAVAGVVLAFFGIPLGSRSWALLLGGVTLFAVVVAVLRRDSAASVVAAGPAVVAPSRRAMSLLQVMILGYAVMVTGAALYAAPRSIAELPDQGTTQLWMLPQAGGVAGAAATIEIGIANHESSAATYRLELRVAGVTTGEWPSIRLEPGQTWRGTADFPAGTVGDLEAVLTKPDLPAFNRLVGLRGTGASGDTGASGG